MVGQQGPAASPASAVKVTPCSPRSTDCPNAPYTAYRAATTASTTTQQALASLVRDLDAHALRAAALTDDNRRLTEDNQRLRASIRWSQQRPCKHRRSRTPAR